MIQQANWICPAKGFAGACPVFRKQFSVNRPVRRAVLLISALGVYEARLGGERVGDFILAPGWTNYNKRLQYQQYDITQMLKKENELCVVVGNGWFGGEISRGVYRNVADFPALIARIEIEYADAGHEAIDTDASWEYACGAICYSDIYHGEHVDARVNPTQWSRCEIAPVMKENLIPQEGEPVTEHERLRPAALLHTPAGETVIDFGQEITGYVEFTVCAAGGEEIVISHAETLDSNGNFYTENLRTAKQEIRYICREGEQTYKPTLTFMGFRYIRLDEFPQTPDLSRFTAIVVHSAMKRTGRFSCSNPLVNKLYDNIIWGQKGNFLDIPTDCPQRDERLGWTGDAQVFIRAAACNFDVERFFAKWLRDMASEQREDGAIPYTIPRPDISGWTGDEFCSGPAWADAAVICPWQLYLAYGDKELLRSHLPLMKKWVDYIRLCSKNGSFGKTGHLYGDWLGLDAAEGDYTGASDPMLISVAYCAYSTSLLVRALEALEEPAEEYQALYNEILASFWREYPVYQTQTECALALYFNLAPNREETARKLARLVSENGNRLTTGFVGTPYLLHALSDNGYTQLAYSLLLQEEFPSWLFSVRMGATTVWEHWDGRKEDGSFWSADMNSFNHYAYGAVADWMYGVAAGIRIDQDRPGYGHIILAPQPDERLSWLEASIETKYGVVSSRWETAGDKTIYEFEVPTSATICLAGRCEEVSRGRYRYEL